MTIPFPLPERWRWPSIRTDLHYRLRREMKVLHKVTGWLGARIIAPAAEQALYFGGLAAVAVGMWQIYHPVGWIVAGVEMVWVAMQIDAERHRAELERAGKLRKIG